MGNFDLKKYLAEGRLLRENALPKEELIQQLIALSSTGELNADEINSLNHQLKSARRKMFASKITPDQRKASAKKASITKSNNAKLEAAQEQVYKILGIDGVENVGDRFALFANQHRNKELQNRFDTEVQKILDKQ